MTSCHPKSLLGGKSAISDIFRNIRVAAESTRSTESLKIKFCGDITSDIKYVKQQKDYTLEDPTKLVLHHFAYRIYWLAQVRGPGYLFELCSCIFDIYCFYIEARIFKFYKYTFDMYGVVFSHIKKDSTLTEHLLKNF